MLRNILRRMPVLYSFARTIRIMAVNVYMFPKRFRINKVTKAKIDALNDFNGIRIWYLCVPVHNNLGDYAQYRCILNWINEFYSGCQCVEIPTVPLCYDYVGVINAIKSKMKKNDIIVFQSGYTSSNLHPDEKVHRRIVRIFRNNSIIFFPQTVRYSNNYEAKKTAYIYNNHKHLTFLTRDEKSFSIANSLFNNVNIYLYPDIVTSLIGTTEIKKSKERDGILFCIRDDSEKYYSDDAIMKQFSELCEKNKNKWLDTTLNKGEKCDNKIFAKSIYEFSIYKLVITDRFHGTIFSLISETPVIVLKTSDHKVSEGANWFLNVYPDMICKAENLEDANKKALRLLNNKKYVEVEPYFKHKYYDKLKSLIN